MWRCPLVLAVLAVSAWGAHAEAAPSPSRTLLVVDDGAVASDLAAAADRGTTVIHLAPGRGVAGLAAAVGDQGPFAAVHVIAHGRPGALIVGGETLDAAALSAHAAEFASWRRVLAPGADILLYGCGTGRGLEGEALLRGLHAVTGADVAASTTPTGAAARGGDWTLEAHVGPIEHALPVAPSALARWDGLLQALDKLYYTGYVAAIHKANLDGSSDSAIFTYPDDPIADGVAVDVKNSRVFMAIEQAGPGFNVHEIAKMTNAGASKVQIVNLGTQFPLAVAYDPVADEVYWLEQSSPCRIRKVKSDGTGLATIVTFVGTPGLRDLEIDHKNRKVYWTMVEPSTASGSVYRANLDGTSQQQLYTGLGVNKMTDIALDVPNNTVYWLRNDALLQKGSLDGVAGVSTVLSGTGATGVGGNARGLAYHRPTGRLFWGDASAGTIRRVDANGSNFVQIVTGGLSQITDVSVENPVPPTVNTALCACRSKLPLRNARAR